MEYDKEEGAEDGREKNWRMAKERGREKVRLVFVPSGSPFERREGNKEDRRGMWAKVSEGEGWDDLFDLERQREKKVRGNEKNGKR